MRAVLVCAICALAVGCIPTEFEDLRAESQVFAMEAPGDYPNTSFGAVVTGFSGTLAGALASRVGASAGPDTPLVTFGFVIDGEVRRGATQADACDTDAGCAEGIGTALFGMPGWRSEELCLASVSPTTGEVLIQCGSTPNRFEFVQGPTGEEFGVSAAGLRTNHRFGRALIGAPAANAATGAIYRLPDGSGPIALDLSAALASHGRLGESVAVAPIDNDRVLIAATATVGPPGNPRRVVIAVGTVAMDGTVTTEVHGCLDGNTDGWGAALAIGDLNGDGMPEVVVGSGAGTNRLASVRVYDGAAMPAAGTCDATWTAAAEISCPTHPDVTCNSAFGSAIAIGDINADGLGDLVVGAPSATVRGTPAAGAVFVFQGAPALADLGAITSTLRHPAPRENAGLGRAVTVASGLGGTMVRDEVVAGAPGSNRVYVFLCTELLGDTPMSTGDPRCQSR